MVNSFLYSAIALAAAWLFAVLLGFIWALYWRWVNDGEDPGIANPVFAFVRKVFSIPDEKMQAVELTLVGMSAGFVWPVALVAYCVYRAACSHREAVRARKQASAISGAASLAISNSADRIDVLHDVPKVQQRAGASS